MGVSHPRENSARQYGETKRELFDGCESLFATSTKRFELKKKMQRERAFREMKRASFYEKPSEGAVRERSEAVRRARKLARKQAIREGLIAAPVKKLDKKCLARPLPNVTTPSTSQI